MYLDRNAGNGKIGARGVMMLKNCNATGATTSLWGAQIILVTFYLFSALASQVFAQTISDYLIPQDIDSYKLDRPEKILLGRQPTGGPEIYKKSPGIVGPADHFSLDHDDTTYKVMYIGGNGIPSPTILVTQHPSSDSDKWLLHESEMDFRNYFGIPGMTYGPRVIDNQTVMEDTVGGIDYRWIAGNIVIDIHYVDLQMTNPEPIEVVRAYLAKHPSTLPAITLAQVRSAENKTNWIKDEMDRRLWLCDKWFMQLQLRKTDENEVYQESVKSMDIFLDYREKYYRIEAINDKNLLGSYLSANNGTGIKAKLAEYKSWWLANKGNAISL